MLQKFALFLLLGLLMSGAVLAQDEEDTGDTTGPTSTVNIFVVICDNRTVVDFNGTMQAGFDIYFQAFTGAGGTGNALTTLRRAAVSGNYTFGEAVNYIDGQTVAAGGTGSVTVSIAREGDPDSTIYTESVNDIQDGCSEPQNSGGSDDLGDGSIGSSGDGSFTRILSPFGGFLNPGYTPTESPIVVIGAADVLPPRQQTPGLIFAECNKYPVANPGLIYDSDRITVFWSWFAKTAEQVQQHIDNAVYEVGYFDSQPFIPDVIRSPIQEIDGLFWVFYTIDVGFAKPGNYPIEYKLSWEQPITDGFGNFGPGTANEQILSNCTFSVEPNPSGTQINHNFP